MPKLRTFAVCWFMNSTLCPRSTFILCWASVQKHERRWNGWRHSDSPDRYSLWGTQSSSFNAIFNFNSHYSTMPRPLSLWSVQTISVNARFRACESAITKPGALSNLLIACILRRKTRCALQPILITPLPLCSRSATSRSDNKVQNIQN